MNNEKAGLFRQEASKSKEVKTTGNVILARPISLFFMTVITIVFFIFFITFISIGSYTKKSTVSGELIPNTGLVQVFSGQQGIISKSHVIEGQHVNKGDTLFILSSERQNMRHRGVQEEVSLQVESRRRSLDEQLQKTHELNKAESNNLKSEILSLTSELEALEEQIASQKKRVSIANESLSRMNSLRVKGFVSQQQYEAKIEESLDQERQLRSLTREKLTSQRLIQNQKNEIISLNLKQKNLISELERDLALASQELTESEARRNLVVIAPSGGIVTAIFGGVGQSAETSRPLLSIIPDGAYLEARLYASSNSVGLLKIGDKLLLRYHAFPYQKYGQAIGQIKSISRTTVTSDQLKIQGTTIVGNQGFYLITASLLQQEIDADGRRYVLHSGMSLDADLLQEERKIYEWILEPILKFYEKI